MDARVQNVLTIGQQGLVGSIDRSGQPYPARRITFLLLPRFSLMSFSGAVEAMVLANSALGYAAYDWRIVSQEGMPIVAHCGVPIASDDALSSERATLCGAERPTDVVLCGGRDFADAPSASVLAWLRECRLRGVSMHALGSAVGILAHAGLLSGRRCAVHWEHYPSFSERYHGIEVTDRLFEADGKVHTCAGGSSTFDHFLCIVEADFGRSIAERVSQLALADRLRNGDERQPSPTPGGMRSNHPVVLKAISLVWEHIEDTLSINHIAEVSGISRRQLERIFEAELSTSPTRQYIRLRLERAHQLLSTSRAPVVDIAISCGFLSHSNFTRLFKTTFGYTPVESRDRRAQ